MRTGPASAMTAGPAIAVVDYGMGNLRSVEAALAFLGARVSVTSDPDVITRARAIVLPGVGSFRVAMQNLSQRGLVTVLRRQVTEHRQPILGVCLGMQLLADEGAEDGPTPGLGLLPGVVGRLQVPPALPVPHIGFNDVSFSPAHRDLFRGLGESADFYFVHSYRMQCSDPGHVAGWCEYGERFVAAVQSGTVFGTQFHPEKSQSNGLKVLANFLERVAA